MSDSFLEWFDQLSFLSNSQGFQLFGKLVIVYLALVWLAIIIWVTRDAIHRSSNVFFQIIAVLMNIFLPLFGLVLYLILRPKKTLLEKYHEDMEYRLLEGGEDICGGCGTPVKNEFSFCPNCGEDLHQECTHCKKKFSRRWHICPYCGNKKQHAPKKKKAKEEKERA